MQAFSQKDNSERDSTRYFGLARYSLRAALKLMNVRSGGKVLVPEFICRDLLAAIHSVGATPVFYRVNEALLPEEPLKNWPKSDVAIAVNYFGFAQNLDAFFEYCRIHDAYLIEDNAHGFLSCDESGVPLGERADIGLFSLRKTILVPNGAALFINRDELLPLAHDQVRFSVERLPLSFHDKVLLSSIQKSCGVPLISIFRELVRLRRWCLTGSAVPPSSPDEEFSLPEGLQPHSYLIDALTKLDAEQEVKRRRNLYMRFEKILCAYDIRPVFSNLPIGTAPYGFPFYASSDEARRVTRRAKMIGFDCISWPDLPRSIRTHAAVHYQNLWLVNFL